MTKQFCENQVSLWSGNCKFSGLRPDNLLHKDKTASRLEMAGGFLCAI